jgi:hypothetical protein
VSTGRVRVGITSPIGTIGAVYNRYFQDHDHVNCRHCGIEISDKAIICFKCGRATADAPATRPGQGRTAARPAWVAVAALVVLVFGALYMGRAATGQLPAWASYTVAALAGVVLIWRIARRRRA